MPGAKTYPVNLTLTELKASFSACINYVPVSTKWPEKAQARAARKLSKGIRAFDIVKRMRRKRTTT